MADPQEIDVKFSGLNTAVNPFSAAPEGAAEIADNVVLRANNLVEPRRGYYTGVPNPSGNIARTFAWGNRIVTYATNGDMRDYSDTTFWSSTYGTYSVPDSSNPIRTATASQNLFWTSSKGVYQLDALGGSALQAGIPAPFPAYYATSNLTAAAGSAWLHVGYSVAYRAVLCRYDSHQNLIQSAPSGRLTVTNSGQSIPVGNMSKANGSSTVTLTFPANHNLTTGYQVDVIANAGESWFVSGTFTATVSSSTVITYSDGVNNSSGSTQTNAFTATAGGVTTPVPSFLLPPGLPVNGSLFAQVYRSVGAQGTPSDELFKVAEGYYLNGALGIISPPTDTTPDSFVIGSPPLYTNANTGQGAATANTQPPLARDLCLFNGYMLYANTTQKQSLALQLIGTQGLVNGSQITIAGVTYTAAATDTFATQQFALVTNSTAAQNIQSTAQNLCDCVNANAYNGLSPVNAQYVSGTLDAPGKIYIQEVGIGGNTFTASASGLQVFVPDISSTAASSSNNRAPAALWWSNPGEPWAVPVVNNAIIGAADQAILRVMLVRQTVFIFKTDGLYALTGNTPSTWQAVPFDPGLVLWAPESCAVVGNRIFCWTNKGVVYVTESGVQEDIDNPIDRDLWIQIQQSPQYATSSFAVPYESEGWWMWALPTSSQDPANSQQYIFNGKLPSWTRWTLPQVVHGCVVPTASSPSGVAVWASGNLLWEERKTLTSADYHDPIGQGSVSSSTNSSNTVVITGATIGNGDNLWQGTTVARVTGVSGTTITLDGSYSFSAASVYVFPAINCFFKILPIVCGDPVRRKRFTNLFASFKVCEAEYINVGFDSDKPSTTTFATFNGNPSSTWGSFPWGGAPWQEAEKNFILRTQPNQTSAESSTLGFTLNIQQADSFWQLQGLKILFDYASVLPGR